MSDNVAVFQTEEQLIEQRILRNLQASDGKERSYFDVMKGVDMSSDLAAPTLQRLLKEGVLSMRPRTIFPSGGRAPAHVTYYQAAMQTVKERLANE